MNNCVLMAQIVQEPQLRYTPDNKLAITEMLVQFPGLRTEDPPATLKVVGLGNLAQEIQQNYHQGDRVILEGRLTMNTVPLEGYKEKRAELKVQRIHPLTEGVSSTSTMGEDVTPGIPAHSPTPTAASRKSTNTEKVTNTSSGVDVVALEETETMPQPKSNQGAYSIPTPETDDDIPF